MKPDFIDMDVKTSPSNYGRLLGKEDSLDPAVVRNIAYSVETSLGKIKDSGIPHRFRITAVPGIVDENDIEIIAGLIGPGESCLISGFSPTATLDPAWREVVLYPDTTLDSFAAILKTAGTEVEVRYNHSR